MNIVLPTAIVYRCV